MGLLVDIWLLVSAFWLACICLGLAMVIYDFMKGD